MGTVADAHPVFLADTLRLGPSHPTDFFRRMTSPAGSFRHPTPWAFLPHLLLTGGTLLLGGVIVALSQRDRGASPA